MSEIKYSIALNMVIEGAQKIEGLTVSVLTAETYILSLLKVAQEEKSAELIMALSLLRSNGLFSEAVENKLRENVAELGNLSYIHVLAMQKMIREAKQKASELGHGELTVHFLLEYILSNPGENLKRLMEKSEGAEGNDGISFEKKLQGTVSESDEKKPSEEELAAGKMMEVKSKMETTVEEVKHIRKVLSETVLGQEHAINTFVTGYFQACMLDLIDKSRKRPKATFLFAGPPGVGKTFLAETVAAELKLPCMRFDMSEYADKEANLEFCGSDKVYKNAKAGNVTSFVAENPRCVLLFDEIEKAHMCVIHLFLQMLDAGRLRDNYTDEEVSFKDTIIILTTNAGRQLYEDSESGDFSTLSRKVVIKALENDKNQETGIPLFPAALCSRFASGNVVMFNHITAHILRDIAKKEIGRHAANLEAETGIKLQVDEKVYTALLFSEGSAADARTIRSRAESFFNDELYELLRLVATEKVKSNISALEKIKIEIDFSKTDSKIISLYENTESNKVLVFASEETVAMCREKLPNFSVVGAQTLEDAIELIRNQEYDVAFIDMSFGGEEESENLNIEDDETEARSFLHFVREKHSELVLYLIETGTNSMNEEEKISFLRQGVRGTLRISGAKDKFAKEVEEISGALYQQKSMIKLARANKVVAFETAQTISKNGKNAVIKLFDFKMSVAVDSEDSKSVLSALSKPNVRFDDVIGAKEAKKELAYFVEYLKNPKKYMGTGVKAPKGVLLYGPPGTGKTMLAKAMACESDVTFIAAEGNQFLKKYVGEGPQKVHELFMTARKYAPSILFIDEIDAVAMERRGADSSTAGVQATLTALLAEMDGFANDSSKPVFVLAATNFDVEPGGSKSLDPALMRRFDRRVYIDLPDKDDRIRFLNMKKQHNRALDISDEKIENISIRSTGMSLAELDSVIELALRSAIREGMTKITDEMFDEAFETFNSGEVKKWDESLLERVARHEAGHAFLSWYGGVAPSYVTVVARGDHGGYMQSSSQEGKALYTKDELLARIRTSLGGRAAELVYYGENDGISTGAGGDLASATNTARNIICTYGMDDSFGLAVLGSHTAMGSELTSEIADAVNKILSEQLKQSIALISENRSKIDALVEVLLVRNHLTGAEIEEIFKNS